MSASVYGIIGWPVRHSLSPAMHNAAFRACGLSAAYVTFPTAPDALDAAIRGVAALGIAGVNVTVPHKTDVLRCLDSVTDEAAHIGAVNTVRRTDEGLLEGCNTDAPGFVQALRAEGVNAHDVRALVLGAGGSARAVAAGLCHAGARSVGISARRSEQARHLRDHLVVDSQSLPLASRTLPATTNLPAHRPYNVTTVAWSAGALQEAFEQTDLLVHTTPATLHGAQAGAELASFLPWSALPKHARVVDLVYTPRETSLLKAARAQGLATHDGLGMLLYQGVLAFEWWTGLQAPVEVMRRALETE